MLAAIVHRGPFIVVNKFHARVKIGVTVLHSGRPVLVLVAALESEALGWVLVQGLQCGCPVITYAKCLHGVALQHLVAITVRVGRRQHKPS